MTDTIDCNSCGQTSCDGFLSLPLSNLLNTDIRPSLLKNKVKGHKMIRTKQLQTLELLSLTKNGTKLALRKATAKAKSMAR